MAKWLVLGEGEGLIAIRLEDIVAVSPKQTAGFRSLITLRNREDFDMADPTSDILDKIADLEGDEQKEAGE